MKPQLLLLTYLIAITIPVHSQYNRIDDKIKQLRSVRTIMVILDDENEKFTKKLEKEGKTEELILYRDFINQYNDAFLDAVQAHWPYDHKVIGKSENELASIPKSEWEDYIAVYLSYSVYGTTIQTSNVASQNYISNGYQSTINIDFKFDELHELYKYAKIIPNPEKNPLSNKLRFTSLVIEPLEDLIGEGNLMATVALRHQFPTSSEIMFALHYSKCFIDAMEIEKSLKNFTPNNEGFPEKLTDLTLVINRDDLDTDITESMANEYFNVPVQIVDKATYDNIILNKISGYAYLMPSYDLPGLSGYTFSVIMIAETGDLVISSHFLASRGGEASKYAENEILNKQMLKFVAETLE